MKKITILALHLGYGGIEKCITSLANALSNNYEVEIILTYKLYESPPFHLNDNIKIIYLINEGPNRVEFINAVKKFQIINIVKEAIKGVHLLKMKKSLMMNAIQNCNSDVIISTRDIHNLWLGKYGKKNILKIGWEHNHHNNNQKYINKIVKSATNLDYFVLVSKDLNEFYRQKLKNLKCETVYIPNTLDYYPKKVSNLDEKRIVSIGRLSPEKGYIDLIDVFNLVHQVYPDWCLDIIGDGVEREKIEEKIKNYHLEQNVILHGFQDKEYIHKVLKKSSIYVMGSHTESFGIVLLEAFSFGIPTVAFNSAEGANDIISNNWDGYLIPNRDKERMARKICELISNPNRRIIMGANGIKKAKLYDINIIKEEWIKLIEK